MLTRRTYTRMSCMHTLEVYTTCIPARTCEQKRLKRAKDESRRTGGSRVIYLVDGSRARFREFPMSLMGKNRCRTRSGCEGGGEGEADGDDGEPDRPE